MSRKELEEAVGVRNTKGTQTGEDMTYCHQCSREQYLQRCIDEKVYNQRTLVRLIRKLEIDYYKRRKIVNDGGVNIDADTGEVLGYEVDYQRSLSSKIRTKI